MTGGGGWAQADNHQRKVLEAQHGGLWRSAGTRWPMLCFLLLLCVSKGVTSPIPTRPPFPSSSLVRLFRPVAHSIWYPVYFPDPVQSPAPIPCSSSIASPTSHHMPRAYSVASLSFACLCVSPTASDSKVTYCRDFHKMWCRCC